jgi:regulator of replication initiation timing
MGLFDRWRRKKSSPTTVSKPPVTKKAVSELSSDDTIIPSNLDSIKALLGEYDNLVERREALSVERENLTLRLERGEIEATEFRKELMSRIQEAAKVSESLRETSARLSELGYRGILL